MIYTREQLMDPGIANLFKSRRRILVTTGGFDPIHSGHIAMLKEFFAIPSALTVIGLNSDQWLVEKKGYAFMPESERKVIVSALNLADRVVVMPYAKDSCQFLSELIREFPKHEIVFAKGGDRIAGNIPEIQLANCSFVFGVGGSEKTVSSSSLLTSCMQKIKSSQFTHRPWGWWTVLDERVVNSKITQKVKMLSIHRGESLSYQKHKMRSEFWFAYKGDFSVKINGTEYHVKENSAKKIPPNTWHQLSNPSILETCQILEIQYGESCQEDDIIRNPDETKHYR